MGIKLVTHLFNKAYNATQRILNVIARTPRVRHAPKRANVPSAAINHALLQCIPFFVARSLSPSSNQSYIHKSHEEIPSSCRSCGALW